MDNSSDDDLIHAKKLLRAEKKARIEESTRSYVEQHPFNTERGSALAVAAYLDGRLSIFLRRIFIQEEHEVENMLRPQAPLGSLGAKIRICYLMGYIKKETYKDLLKIAEIRNIFAHKVEARDFTFPTIYNLCLELRIMTNQIEFLGSGDKELGTWAAFTYKHLGQDLANVRWAYLVATHFLSKKFEETQLLSKNNRPSIKTPLF